MKTLTIAAKRIGDMWNGAVAQNNDFQRSFIEKELSILMEKALLGEFLEPPEGTTVVVTVNYIDGPMRAAVPPVQP